MVDDGGLCLVVEIVVEETVSANVACDGEEQSRVAVAGKVGCAGEVHELTDVADLAARRDGKPLIEECGFRWAVAAVAVQRDLKETPVFVGLVGGVDMEVAVGVGESGELFARGVAVDGVGEESAEGLMRVGDVERHGREGSPVLWVGESGERGGEDSVSCIGLVWVAPGFEVGD